MKTVCSLFALSTFAFTVLAQDLPVPPPPGIPAPDSLPPRAIAVRPGGVDGVRFEAPVVADADVFLADAWGAVAEVGGRGSRAGRSVVAKASTPSSEQLTQIQ